MCVLRFTVTVPLDPASVITIPCQCFHDNEYFTSLHGYEAVSVIQ